MHVSSYYGMTVLYEQVMVSRPTITSQLRERQINDRSTAHNAAQERWRPD
jgi:hypothetical protein